MTEPKLDILDIEDEVKKEYLDFVLDKTYRTYIEAGSNVGKAFLTHLLLISVATLLVLGEGMANEVKVPFLDLKIDRQVGIQVLSAKGAKWESLGQRPRTSCMFGEKR